MSLDKQCQRDLSHIIIPLKSGEMLSCNTTSSIFQSLSQRGGASEFSGEMIGWVLSGFSGGIQGIQVLKNTIRNYIRTTRMEDGAHSGDG